MERALQYLLGFAAMIIGGWLTMWFIWRTIKKSEDPGRILYKWIISFILIAFLIFFGATGGGGMSFAFAGPITAAIVGVILGILWAPHIGAVMAKPFTGFYDGGDEQPEDRPFYSIARAKIKRGKYEEAIAEVRKQLERFSEDYEGWMLLADIYAENLKDNVSAQECLNEILRHEGHAPRNIVYTLNRSADWHLQHNADRESARAALEEIIRRFPDSEHAHFAGQRIAHLTSDQMLVEQRNRPTLHLERRDEYIGLQGKVADPRAESQPPAAQAARLVEHLTIHPQDAEAREQLANLYAQHYRRMDLATDQLEQLITSMGASPKEISRWLNMLVDFHVNIDQDREAARAALERIGALFPGSAVAGLAQSRLAYLEGEFRKNSKSQVIKLGSYDDNVGLNGQLPRRGD